MSEPGIDERPRLVLIDGYGLIFRAYHALPPTMATRTGEQTNAVYGFTAMLLDVIKHHRPEFIAVALESGKTFRHDSYDGYKANRGEMPDDLRQQVGRVRELIGALNIPIFEQAGYEADDIIGSLSRSAAADGYTVIIVTGDSDLLQLVDDHIIAVLPGARRFGEFRLYDVPAVIERYGFPPELVPDYKGLVGDTSDNIPGVPGIGEKTAKALIERFGSLESIIEHVDEVTPTRAKNALAEHTGAATFSKQLATIVRDLEIPFEPEDARVESYDKPTLLALFQELEFRNLINKLPETNGMQPTGRTASPAHAASSQPSLLDAPLARNDKAPSESSRTLVNTEEELRHLATRMRETGRYAVDVETTSTDPLSAELVGIAIAVSASEGYYIPVKHQDWTSLSLDAIRDAIGPALGDPDLRGYTHHGKYDLQVLERHGFTIGRIDFDTMIAAYLLGDNSLRLKDMAFNRLGIQMTEIAELIGTGRNQLTMNMVSAEEAAQYASGDVEATFALVENLTPEVEQQEQMNLLQTIELPLIPVLVRMERTGVAIDTDYLEAFSAEIAQRFAEIEAEIYRIVGRVFNINSTKQIATLLFDELKLPSGRKTKTGYSVDFDVLENLRDQNPVVGLILEHRTLGKLKSTYVDALPLQVNPRTGRIHTNYNQTVAATGRLSSQNPNLQNIPIRTEMGRRVREAFVADHRPSSRLFTESTLISADYSQIELRLLAHLSGEPFLVEAFRAGQDIHTVTASLVYGVSLEDVTSDMRRVAKTVNFGILYGMQAFGLSRDTGLSRQEAQRFIDEYWSRLPGVRSYFDQLLNSGVTNGYMQTMAGRRRAVPDLTASNQTRRNAAERMATNMPLQGSAADIMKVAMLRLDERIREKKLPAAIILQVHDELVLEVDANHTDEIAREVKDVMEHAWKLSVPLEVEVSSGDNWNQMIDIEL